ncbi:copper homeostasis protein CutC [Streptomyces sp. SID3343]|uniref:copper homeostasis protein CutC n=1 Tax=Streptomyces sp. SID3343 TaxID=2690260 RepID=UPI00136BFBDB|nr:copper homeostasis protein CutC [Streptomyces sp. SID3343]MYW03826.1 copper homeostasis protein CutC [Streptomyces sp. SID3343]
MIVNPGPNPPLTYEICIDDVPGALAAERAGAHRVELCADLFEGGITPSLGLIETTLRAVDAIRVHVIIRPRGGDFVFDEYEVAAMERDVIAAREAGAHGVVIGALTPEGDIDRPTIERLLAAAGDCSVTFHRAFDMTRDPFATLEALIELGVHRVLTSGQDSSVLEGAPLIADLVDRAAGRIVVMPGGGITARNIERVIAATGAHEVHFAAGEVSESTATHRNPYPYMGGALRQAEYARRVTSLGGIQEIVGATRRN